MLPSPAHAERRLTLGQAVELALATDPLVAESHVQEDRARLGVLRAQLDRVSIRVDAQLQELWNKSNVLGPTVYNCSGFGQLDADTCRSLGGTPVPADDQSPSYGQGLLSLTAQVNAPVFTGFRITSNVKRAQLGRDTATAAIRQQRKDTALAVARAYWSVRRLQLIARVQEASLQRMREAEAITDGRVRAGLAPPIDFNRARLKRVTQEAQLADLIGQARESAAQLAVALGVGDTLVLTDEPAVPDQAPAPVEELIDRAKNWRPEVEMARLQLRMQEQAVRVAQSTYYPQLAAFGLFQYGNNPYIPGLGARSASSAANPFTNLSGNLTLGAVMSINLFDTLSTWSTVRDARFEQARLAEESRRWGRTVEGDVRFAHARLYHLYDRRAPLVAAAEIARDNVLILEGRYKNGDALVIELLDAQNDLADLERQIADVTSQLQLGWLELDAALGRTVGLEQR